MLVFPKNPTFCSVLRFVYPWVTPTIFRKLRFGKMHVFPGFCAMLVIGDPENLTFCSTTRFDGPYSNPYDFPKTVFMQNTRFPGVLQESILGDPEKPYVFVIFFCLLIPVAPTISENGVLAKYTLSYGFARCPFLVMLRTLRFVALLGLMIPTPTPAIFWKWRFSKIHVSYGFVRGHIRRSWKTLRFVAFVSLLIPMVNPTIFRKWRFSKMHVILWFCKTPILVIPKNPTFCSILQFVDP